MEKVAVWFHVGDRDVLTSQSRAFQICSECILFSPHQNTQAAKSETLRRRTQHSYRLSIGLWKLNLQNINGRSEQRAQL